MISPFSLRRFRDSKGNWIDGVGLLYAPRALVGSLLCVLFGYRPLLPWLSFRAIHTLDNLIEPQWKVLEFGSGMSTIWLARRCSLLHSIESDPGWYNLVSQRLQRERHDHVHYELRRPDSYADLQQYPNGFFDFALIDGLNRSECVRQVIDKVRAGGWVYLDNCDADPEPLGGEMRIAEQRLLDAASARNGSSRYFVDYSPTQFFVNQGLLAQLNAAPVDVESTLRPQSV